MRETFFFPCVNPSAKKSVIFREELSEFKKKISVGFFFFPCEDK